MGPKAVATDLGKDYNQTRQLMYKMAGDGQLSQEGYGEYVVARGPVYIDNIGNTLTNGSSVNDVIDVNAPSIEEATNTANGEGPILTAQDVAEILKRPNKGPRLNPPLYLAEETTLEILTRSVLVTEGMDPAAWKEYAAVVEEAANDPKNHPLGCECEGCL